MKNLKLPFPDPKPNNPMVLDVETQYLASEIEGGWKAIDKFRVSVAVTWDKDNDFRVWQEEDCRRLIEEMYKYSPIITFNGERFDFIVLSAYGNVTPLYEDSRDILRITEGILGHRVYLDSIAKATFGIEKTGDGLKAVEWWRSGDPALKQKVIDYCKDDVKITRDIYFFVKGNGFLYCTDLHGGEFKYDIIL